MGMIYKRGQIWWLKYHVHGRPIRESSHSTKETEAKRLLRLCEGKVAEGRVPGFYFDKVRFDELAGDLLDDYKINGKQVKRAQERINHLRKDFGGLRAAMINTPRIRKYIQHREAKGAAPATINRELAVLKRMLNMGAKQTPPKVDRVPHIPMLKINNARKGFFEHPEFLALRQALPEHLKGLSTFAYKTGWRLSEVVNLEWRQVDLEQGIVRLEPGETKNKEARTIKLDDEVQGIIRAQAEARRRASNILPWVFLNRKGTDRVREFYGPWETAWEKAGIGPRLFHDLRRTAVRNMVRAGVPERVVMSTTGHKTRAVFDRYNIVNEFDLELAAKKQEEYLQRQKGTILGTILGTFSGKKPVTY